MFPFKPIFSTVFVSPRPTLPSAGTRSSARGVVSTHRRWRLIQAGADGVGRWNLGKMQWKLEILIGRMLLFKILFGIVRYFSNIGFSVSLYSLMSKRNRGESWHALLLCLGFGCVGSLGLLLWAISIRMAMRKQVPTSEERQSKVAHSRDFLGV